MVVGRAELGTEKSRYERNGTDPSRGISLVVSFRTQAARAQARSVSFRTQAARAQARSVSFLEVERQEKPLSYLCGVPQNEAAGSHSARTHSLRPK